MENKTNLNNELKTCLFDLKDFVANVLKFAYTIQVKWDPTLKDDLLRLIAKINSKDNFSNTSLNDCNHLHGFLSNTFQKNIKKGT